ncbi:EF-hand domain-containing protein [Rhodopseudomonas palustris]|nr:EF-hand domain-containing protein [Rhodopseudomonas palustris]
MMPALGALGALSGLLNSLSSSSSSKASAKTTGLTNPFESSSSNPSFSSSNNALLGSSSSNSAFPSSGLSPEVLKALLAAQQNQASTSDPSTTATKSRDAALKDLFSQLDGDGDGAISKAEFEDKLGAGGTNISNADKVFTKLDSNGDGSVRLNELSSALKPGKGRHHGQDGGNPGGGSGDPMMQALSGSSSTSVKNADGTVTTSITYADGSKVSMTSAAGASSSSATSSYNFVEQLIQRQATHLQSATASSLSVSA